MNFENTIKLLNVNTFEDLYQKIERGLSIGVVKSTWWGAAGFDATSSSERASFISNEMAKFIFLKLNNMNGEYGGLPNEIDDFTSKEMAMESVSRCSDKYIDKGEIFDVSTSMVLFRYKYSIVEDVEFDPILLWGWKRYNNSSGELGLILDSFKEIYDNFYSVG